MDGRLNGRAPHEADAVEQLAKVADVESRVLAIDSSIGQRAFGTRFGSACQHGLEFDLGHAHVALIGARWRHDETIPASVGSAAVVQGVLSAGFTSQVE